MCGSHISLFSGVGMTDIAAEQRGFETIATAEIDPFCRQVLRARFPQAIHYRNVESVRASQWPAGTIKRPLLISGGFPCQDVSSAGTAKGVSEGARSGLWSEFLRIIKEFNPEYVLIENSPLLRSRGLDVVLRDLYGAGYDAQWDCIPAASVGAPHLRDRIWVLAQPSSKSPSTSMGLCAWSLNTLPAKLPRAGCTYGASVWEVPFATTIKGAKARNSRRTLYPTPTTSDGSGGPGTTPKRTGGKNLRTVVNELDGSGRLNPEWVEWMMGLPVGWTDPTLTNDQVMPHHGWGNELLPRTAPTGMKDRTKRIKALGNGLVPQVAEIPLGWTEWP